jgi:hypothetical protein
MQMPLKYLGQAYVAVLQTWIHRMPKRRCESEDENEEPEPQRRRKHDKSLSIVERMEAIMDELKGLLPNEYPLRSVIYEIPRNLVESEPSAAQMSTDLRVFKDYLQISDELEALKEGADSECLLGLVCGSRFDQISGSTRMELISCQLYLKNLILLAGGM